MRIVSGHQPVYLPWLGLFHKLMLCDAFVFMDTVQFLKNDWNNRNKIRTSDGWMWLTIPIDRRKTVGNKLNQIIIKGYEVPESRGFWQKKHWEAIERNYKKARYFNDYADDLYSFYNEQVYERLIDVCWHQFNLFNSWLGIRKKIVRMSEKVFEGQKDDLILDHARRLNGDSVVFGKHGRDYVDVQKFSKDTINVTFQEYRHPEYKQRYAGFESCLSVLDLILNHGPESLSMIMDGNISYKDLLSGLYWEN